MSSETTERWTDKAIQDAARNALTHDAHIYAVAYRAALLTVPSSASNNESLIRALRDVAMQSAAIALLVQERGDDD